jgi:dTDP-glucose 4,6-dehydratase
VKNILVTGGAGFIGSNFIHHLFAKNEINHLVNLDVLTYAGNLENLQGLSEQLKYTFIHGDINSSELVEHILADYSIDTIVHFAAETHVDRSIVSPDQFILTNINGTFTLLEAARKCWLGKDRVNVHDKRFHHISTDEVYGSLEPRSSPFNEKTLYDPHSPYSASKAASDYLVRSYFYTYGLPITISNCSNNYGPYQFPEKLIPLAILNAIQGKTIPIYGEGNQIRDWLYVTDHCEAIWQIIERGKVGESYNIGGNNQPTNLEIVHMLCQILDQKLPGSEHKPHSNLLRFITDRPGHDYRYAMDISKIQRELGWTPQVALFDGLNKTVDWYLGRTEWVNHIVSNQQYRDWIGRFH